jgi:hypothetical protein
MDQESDTPQEVFAAAFKRFLVLIIKYMFHMLTGLAVFGSLLLFAWTISLAHSFGLGSERHVESYRVVHGRLDICLFAVVGSTLLVDTAKAIVRGGAHPLQALKDSWSKFFSFTIEFGLETLAGILIFLMFLIFSKWIVFSSAFGLGSDEEFKAFEFLLFWFNYALFTGLGAWFLLRMGKALLDEFV